ncbi:MULTISPECIES: lytic transglycosylase domain-containing protein [Roseinatronobacter]|uniref:Lytic transglycosylase domain-containing protein n=1 Tax=Roseinatronobacter domitianus TaxID=2940293 RepID=A0ABT0M5F3_9RHOB|nr:MULTISPECIES: lytic transglycosylase domain-containing protein [Roseibaca]MCL1629620.1 lytic transglycosylase domain-containing protein [Roseibaca domitiana]
MYSNRALMAALCMATLPGLASAQEQGDRDFTFRRIAVGESGAGKRITVQIDPAEQAARIAAAPRVPQTPPPTPEGAPDRASPGNFAWFWERVPPKGGPDVSRFLAARDVLTAPPAGTNLRAPRLQDLQNIAESHASSILRATVGTRVSPALALAVISVESAGRADAISSANAQGLMQLIPATAERFGVTDPFDTGQNITGGVRYLHWLMERFDNDVVLVLAGYNAGEGAVDRNGGVPPFAETRDYVPKVLAAWQVARGLCATVPELPSDPCVFKIAQAG